MCRRTRPPDLRALISRHTNARSPPPPSRNSRVTCCRACSHSSPLSLSRVSATRSLHKLLTSPALFPFLSFSLKETDDGERRDANLAPLPKLNHGNDRVSFASSTLHCITAYVIICLGKETVPLSCLPANASKGPSLSFRQFIIFKSPTVLRKQ